MTTTDAKRFRPRWAAAGAIAGCLTGWLYGMEWPDALVGAGVGFLMGGAAPLFAGIWRYLAVFFALTGGFVLLLVHYLR